MPKYREDASTLVNNLVAPPAKTKEENKGEYTNEEEDKRESKGDNMQTKVSGQEADGDNYSDY